ncbi:MAG: MFS transporter [Bacteroidota bacterium]|nr:MFS transporter [Bacteroidota bacterium]
MKGNIEANIFKLYVIKVSKWFTLVMPIVVLFYQKHGLSMQDIFLLKSVYSIGIVAFEIPSGYMADVWGRKKTLVLGSFLCTVGFMIYCVNGVLAGFFIAEFILGVGQSFISGSDSALLYDTLKYKEREQDYVKEEGIITSIGNFSEAFAGILGGLLATVSLQTPYYVQVVIAGLAIPASLTLIEPPIEGKKLPSLRNILNIVKMSLFTEKDLRISLLFSSLIGAATLTFAWFVQPFLQQAGLPLALFGLMWTLLNLTAGFSSIFAHKAGKRLNAKLTYLLVLAATSILYFITSQTICLWGIATLFVFYIIRGSAHPIMKDYIHQNASSEVRATVLSLRDMTIRIFFALLGPLVGWLSDAFSLKTALAISSLVFLVVGLIIISPLLIERSPR